MKALGLVLGAAVLLGSGGAWAWEPFNANGSLQRTTTRVLAVRQEAAVGDRNNAVVQVYVLFEDDPTAVCQRLVPAFPTGASGAPPPNPLRYVYVGQSDWPGARVLLAQLLSAKSAGTELTVVVEQGNCVLKIIEG